MRLHLGYTVKYRYSLFSIDGIVFTINKRPNLHLSKLAFFKFGMLLILCHDVIMITINVLFIVYLLSKKFYSEAEFSRHKNCSYPTWTATLPSLPSSFWLLFIERGFKHKKNDLFFY